MRNTLLIIGLSTCLAGCYSLRKTVEESRPHSEEIDWPAPYRPAEAGFFVHNEIDIQAAPQVVWDILIEAGSWPEWYQGMTDVTVRHEDRKLRSGTLFSFRTMGQYFDTVAIREFEAPYRLSWEAVKKDIRGYHAWLIIPTEGGCRVITSESQHGLKAFMQKAFLPNKLWKLHEHWLEQLKSKAENEGQ